MAWNNLMNDLIETTFYTPVPEFRWRDRFGNMIPVSELDTKHLFFTIRMIWNHSAPERMRIEPYRQYTFGAHYTPEYMGQAVRAIAIELSHRTDTEPYFIRCLRFMEERSNSVFGTRRLEHQNV